MHKPLIVCRDCGKEFFEKPSGSRGYRNQCTACAIDQQEPEPTGGNMVWDHKTAPYIELKPMSRAQAFNAMANRHKGR